VLQFWLSVPCPTHAAPLALGNGELHRRVRDWVPVAQVLEHALHAVKDDQPPLMALTPEAVQSPLTLWFTPSLWSNSRHLPWAWVGCTVHLQEPPVCEHLKLGWMLAV